MSTTITNDCAKPRLEILDGLRGVAAIIVVAFHIFEVHSKGPALQIINHGYLAVDFFFALSGFVLGYAYDDRWKSGDLTLRKFITRRLIRLQPMVFMGATLGMLTFYFGYANIDQTPVTTLLLVWLLSCMLIPTPRRFNLRGWGEGYSLDGPQWSLAFEYVANLLYATILRRFPKWLLGLFVVAAALLSIDVSLNIDTLSFLENREKEMYTMIGGWSLDPTQLYIGFARLLYPFFAGLLVYRLGWRIKTRYAFPICSLIITAVLLMPRVGLSDYHWSNGLYEAACVLVIFPIVLIIGSGITSEGRRETSLCRWLGRISYPLYITHYPLIYIMYKWTADHPHVPLSVNIFNGIAIMLLAISIAHACERLYDLPVRKWLTHRLLPGKR